MNKQTLRVEQAAMRLRNSILRLRRIQRTKIFGMDARQRALKQFWLSVFEDKKLVEKERRRRG
jgi:hypothetical protein